MDKKRTTAVDDLMNEFVCWGGPIVRRADAYRDGKLRGFSDWELDMLVFGRPAVPAPDDPDLHFSFLLRIQQTDGIGL